MKRKMVLTISCVVTFALLFVLPISSAAKQELPEYNNKKAQITKFANSDESLNSMDIAAEDSKSILYYDANTANIALKSKMDSYVWFSAPITKPEYSSVSSTQQQILLSPVILSFTDENLTKHTLYSFSDCAVYGQIKHKKTDNGVVFTMTLGKMASNDVLPQVITIKTAQYLEKKLSEKDYKYFMQSYRPVKLKGDNTDKTLLADYPILKKEIFYSIRVNTSEAIKGKLINILSSIDYTRELLEADEELIYGNVKSGEQKNAIFTFDLEYKIEDGQLVANIPIDRITYDRDKFKLIDIELLRYFGADGLGDSGYFMLPDGSGTVAEYSNGIKGNGSPITIELYGNDSVYRYDSQHQFIKNGLIPVYGQKSGDSAYIAIVENGDAQSTVYSVIDEIETGLRYTNFICKTRLSEKYVHSERASNDEYIRSSVNEYKGNYTIRYIPLLEASYSGMANAYRQYLIKNKSLNTKVSSKNGLYIELLGAIDSKYNGIFSDTDIFPLTTFEDANKITKEFAKESNLNVILKGFANGGLNHTVYSNVDVVKKLGGKQGLKKFIDNTNASVSFAVDMSYVYSDKKFDNFSKTFNATHRLDNSYAHIYPYNFGSNLGDYSRPFYTVKSNSMVKYNKKVINNLSDNLKGLVYENIGNVINSDSSKKSGSRTEAMNDYIKILKSAKGKYELGINGGNLYSYKYADVIHNLENNDSGYRNTSYSIPFVQMVLHGYIPYNSYSLNLAENYEYAYLKAIENGEQLSYTLGYRNLDKLTKSSYSEYNSVDYNYWKSIIKKDYHKAEKLLSDTYDKKIIKHCYLDEAVVSVTYENNVNIIVNYSYDDYYFNGITVKAHDAIRVEN